MSHELTGVPSAANTGLGCLAEELLAFGPEQARSLRENVDAQRTLSSSVRRRAREAYLDGKAEALRDMHSSLAKLYALEFDMVAATRISRELGCLVADVREVIEDEMLEFECRGIDRGFCEDSPVTGAEYVPWLKRVISKHPASIHPFYVDYLRHTADVDDLRYFLIQETTLDPRFDDILALLQLGVTGEMKMEIASNYWDEMGQGDQEQVHTRLFSRALKALDIGAEAIRSSVTTEALMCGNLSACLSLHRPLFAMGIGYFGVTEYLAPRRFKDFVAAWQRNDLPKEAGEYHTTHIAIDAAHGVGWLQRVIAPLVDEHPQLAQGVTLGALLRMDSSERYLDALLHNLTR